MVDTCSHTPGDMRLRMSVCNASLVMEVMLSLVGCSRSAVYHSLRVKVLRTAFILFINSGSFVMSM